MAFMFPMKMSLSQLRSSWFTLPILPLVPLWGSGWGAAWGWLKPWHLWIRNCVQSLKPFCCSLAKPSTFPVLLLFSSESWVGSSLQRELFLTQVFPSSRQRSVISLRANDWKPTKKYCTSPPSPPPSPRVILVELWLMSDEINWKHLMCLTCKGLGLYSLTQRLSVLHKLRGHWSLNFSSTARWLIKQHLDSCHHCCFSLHFE